MSPLDEKKGVWKSGRGKGRKTPKGRQLDDRALAEVLAPLNRSGDIEGASLENGVVRSPAGFDVAYRFDDGARLGVKFSHISNARIHESNEGAESFLLTYSMPLGNMFPGSGISF